MFTNAVWEGHSRSLSAPGRHRADCAADIGPPPKDISYALQPDPTNTSTTANVPPSRRGGGSRRDFLFSSGEKRKSRSIFEVTGIPSYVAGIKVHLLSIDPLPSRRVSSQWRRSLLRGPYLLHRCSSVSKRK